MVKGGREMLTMDKIREDLRAIRCYYTRKELFDEAYRTVGENAVVKTVQKYNAVICEAPAQLYALYVGLYVNNVSQEALAEELNYSPDYISKQNRKLLRFLQMKSENQGGQAK